MTGIISLLGVFLDRQGSCLVCQSSECLECWHCEQFVWDITTQTHLSVSLYSKQRFLDSPNHCPFCDQTVSNIEQVAHCCATIHKSLIILTAPREASCSSAFVSELSFLDKFLYANAKRSSGPVFVAPTILWDVVVYNPGSNDGNRKRGRAFCRQHSTVFVPAEPKRPRSEEPEDDGLMRF